jgi:hypothetical protein
MLKTPNKANITPILLASDKKMFLRPDNDEKQVQQIDNQKQLTIPHLIDVNSQDQHP